MTIDNSKLAQIYLETVMGAGAAPPAQPQAQQQPQQQGQRPQSGKVEFQAAGKNHAGTDLWSVYVAGQYCGMVGLYQGYYTFSTTPAQTFGVKSPNPSVPWLQSLHQQQFPEQQLQAVINKALQAVTRQPSGAQQPPQGQAQQQQQRPAGPPRPGPSPPAGPPRPGR